MKLDIEIRLNTIYNCDCLDKNNGLSIIPEKSIDFILCDLPYGTTDIRGWDKQVPMEQLWPLYKRIIKDNGTIALFGSQPFSSYLIMSNPEMFRYEWIWDKHRGANFLNANCQPLKVHENILIFTKLPTSPNKNGNAKYNPQRQGNETRTVTSGRRGKRGNINGGTFDKVTSEVKGKHPTSILSYSKDGTLHPTQKPVALCEFLIRSYTNEDDIVLDNCMGSGTTAISAINTGRNYIGWEMDIEYFEKSLRRINDHVV